MPFYGTAIICIDEKKGEKLFNDLSRPKISYGFNKSADYYLKDLKQTSSFQEFTLVRNSVGKEVRLQLKIAGRHNALNATAAYIVAKEAGIATKIIRDSLKSFGGVSRRLEFKGDLKINDKKIKLLDDYGHHPTEISPTVEAIKSSYKNKKINMIFQPHRFSRTAQLFDDFIKVLKQTDSLIMLDIYSASEKPIKGINSRRIVETLKQNGHKDVTYLKKHDDVIDLIKKKKDDFDILVTQGAGSVSNICQIIKNQWET